MYHLTQWYNWCIDMATAGPGVGSTGRASPPGNYPGVLLKARVQAARKGLSAAALQVPPSDIRFVEYLLDTEAEDVGNTEGERQRRVEPAVLDGVDGIARDAHALRQFRLAPFLAGAQHADAVFHGDLRRHVMTVLHFLPCAAAR